MGWVLMSERELNRIEVLSQVKDGKISVPNAAQLLNLTKRQIYRLMHRFLSEGPSGLQHRSRGQAPNNQISQDKREFVLSIIKERYRDFGPTLICEKLREMHDICVSRETLRKWMIDEGLWLSRVQRKQFHQPRLRRECLGELIQIDGSDHRWFEERGPACTLLVFIDDATSTLMQLRFVKSESTFSYFEALDLYLQKHGRPVAFYSDKHTVFRVSNQEAKSGFGMTQFGRALNELNVEIICANSSQAKGRVERANRTLQDRLVKELRLAEISDIDTANAFLPEFMERYNEKFAKPAFREQDLHRALNVEPDRLREILCLRDERYVGRQLSFSYNRRRIILEDTGVSRHLEGKYVDSYEYADGRLEFRWKGMQLAYRAFDNDQQRVTHTAVTENKRLGEVLEQIKQSQEETSVKPMKVGKQRTRYTPKTRKT